MANEHILTSDEAADFVRSTTDDSAIQTLLPLVDKFVEKATGRDWTQDNVVNLTAKAAAGMLLVQWYDNPGMGSVQGADSGVLPYGLTNVLSQLEAEALKYRKYTFYGISGVGAVTLTGARVGDVVQKLRGVYGSSGDQSASFESTITEADQIQQTSGSDLSEKIYAVVLKNPADDISA